MALKTQFYNQISYRLGTDVCNLKKLADMGGVDSAYRPPFKGLGFPHNMYSRWRTWVRFGLVKRVKHNRIRITSRGREFVFRRLLELDTQVTAPVVWTILPTCPPPLN